VRVAIELISEKQQNARIAAGYAQRCLKAELQLEPL